MRMMPAAFAVGLVVASTGCGRDARDQALADSLAQADSAALVVQPADSPAPGRAAAPRNASRAPAGELIVAVREGTPGLLAQARYLPIDAQHLAQTKYPEGQVKGAVIERRSGALVYVYEIQQPGVEGSELVLVNASNGTIVNTIHQDPVVAAGRP